MAPWRTMAYTTASLANRNVHAAMFDAMRICMAL